MDDGDVGRGGRGREESGGGRREEISTGEEVSILPGELHLLHPHLLPSSSSSPSYIYKSNGPTCTVFNTRFCISIALYLRLNTHVVHEQNLPCSISCLAAMTRENFAMLIAIKHVLSFAHFWYSSRVTHTPHPSKIRTYQSQVVRNTVRIFGEIQLTMLEKYSKRRSDPDFCDGRR